MRWLARAGSGLLFSVALAASACGASSTVEKVSDDVYCVRDDNGNWGGMTTGITHQRGPNYQAKKVLDLTGVPESVWNAAAEVRLSVYLTVRDYSHAEQAQANGLDEAIEIAVNGKVQRVPTGAGLPVYDEAKPGPACFRWHDFRLSKDAFVRGTNEIVFRMASDGKDRPDDYLYLGIDNTVPTARSWMSHGQTPDWQQERLTMTGGKGEYMVRLYLLSGPRELEATWTPADGRMQDPAGVIAYAGSHSGAARMEWDANRFDFLSPVRVTVKTGDATPLKFFWLNEQGETVTPAVEGTGPEFATILEPGRDSMPKGLQFAGGATPQSVTLHAARSYHPIRSQIDMAPRMASAQGQALDRSPSCQIDQQAIVLTNGALRCRLTRTDGRLRLASLWNEITASEMVRNADDSALLLVEVDDVRYAGSRDFALRSVAPLADRQGFVAVLVCEPARVEAELTVWIDEALRMGLKLTARGESPVDFKTAFPHLSGLTVSEDPADDYYFYPWGGGIIADVPATIRRGYGDHEAIYQLMDLFSPARGGGLALWCTDDDGRYKVLALRKHLPGTQELNGDVNRTPAREPYVWSNSLEPSRGTGLALEYLRRTRKPGESFLVKEVALKAHAGDWRVPMQAYADRCHRVWKFRPYPSRLKSVHNMIAAGWGKSPLFADGKYRTDFVRPHCDCIELMSWWEWSELGPFATPFDDLEAKIGKAKAERWASYFLNDPVTGRLMYSNNPGDYDGYNARWGGLPALRKAIDTYRDMGALVTLYTDPFRADYNTKFGRNWGEKWSIVQEDGQYQSHYEAWNPCLDVAEYRRWVAETMGRVLQETGADGIRLDEYGHRGSVCFSKQHEHTFAEPGTTEWQRAVAESTRLVREAMDKVNPASVLTTEHPGYDYLTQYLEGCITYDLTVQATPLRPMECNLQRFYFPECKAYELDHRRADAKHRKRFWNAVGSFGSYYPEPYDRILRENEDVFAARDCEPLIPTLARQVYANRFQEGQKTIFTVYNATGHTFAGPVLDVDVPPQQHVFDLLRGAEADCRQNAGGTRIDLYLPQDDVACLLRVPKRLALQQAGMKLSVTVSGDAADCQARLCSSDGREIAVAAVKDGVATFEPDGLPKDVKPSLVKLLQRGQLIDIAALP